MHPFLNTAIRAARKAGDIIARAVERPDTFEITEKGHNDFATNVDRQAESAIIDIIRKAYPHHHILAEESGKSEGSHRANATSLLESTHDITWIIDPLDGTTNFIHGLPHFAVSIAIQQGAQIEHGVIYDPIRQELFSATRGAGAQLNDRKIRVSRHPNIEAALLSIHFKQTPTQTISIETLAYLFDSLQSRVAGLRRSGSATLDLAYVAAGRLDGSCEWGLQPWDVAAGSLLVQEAGGMVTDPRGQDTYLSSGNIVATNPKLLFQLLDLIKQAGQTIIVPKHTA